MPDPNANQLIDDPAPISAHARKAMRDAYNPFDDGTDDDEDSPRGKHSRKRKDDYNPFAKPATQDSAPGAPAAQESFDFGAVEPGEQTSDDEFDFGTEGTSRNRGRQRRRQ